MRNRHLFGTRVLNRRILGVYRNGSGNGAFNKAHASYGLLASLRAAGFDNVVVQSPLGIGDTYTLDAAIRLIRQDLKL